MNDTVQDFRISALERAFASMTGLFNADCCITLR